MTDQHQPHPDKPHDFDMTCRLCGQPGQLFVAFTTPGERVTIEPASLLASEPEPEPMGGWEPRS